MIIDGKLWCNILGAVHILCHTFWGQNSSPSPPPLSHHITQPHTSCYSQIFVLLLPPTTCESQIHAELYEPQTCFLTTINMELSTIIFITIVNSNWEANYFCFRSSHNYYRWLLISFCTKTAVLFKISCHTCVDSLLPPCHLCGLPSPTMSHLCGLPSPTMSLVWTPFSHHVTLVWTLFSHHVTILHTPPPLLSHWWDLICGKPLMIHLKSN